MTKFLLPIAALALAAPAFAQADERPVSFERDGIHYVATVKTIGDIMIIDGREIESGKTFSLRAKQGNVSGVYASTPVSYSLPR